VLEHAIRSAELSEAVESIVSNQLSDVSGTLRLSSMPSVSDTLVTPLVTAFQAAYPHVRIQVLVTERLVDLITEGVDLAFRLGALKDSCLVARKLLTYRHQLVASPSYLKAREAPRKPQDLLNHRLLTFSYWKPENSWTLVHHNGRDREMRHVRDLAELLGVCERDSIGSDGVWASNALTVSAGEIPFPALPEPRRPGTTSLGLNGARTGT
jgi:DNA-binding transcriptional LysR family regulator